MSNIGSWNLVCRPTKRNMGDMKHEKWNRKTWNMKQDRGSRKQKILLAEFWDPLSKSICTLVPPDCCPSGLHFCIMGTCLSGNRAGWHHSWVLFLCFVLNTFSVKIRFIPIRNLGCAPIWMPKGLRVLVFRVESCYPGPGGSWDRGVSAILPASKEAESPSWITIPYHIPLPPTE
jgi:hypothetical protein